MRQWQNSGPESGGILRSGVCRNCLSEWLEIEKSRSDFSIGGIEAERVVSVAGLQIKIRADRVDVLPDGREIILDYKTGQLKSRGWEGDRPDEPQLPLYCATSDQPVAGAAFAMIRTGELRFRGLTASDVTLPALTKCRSIRRFRLSGKCGNGGSCWSIWRKIFAHGKAEVDPKPGACDNCGLRALCRIRELQK